MKATTALALVGLVGRIQQILSKLNITQYSGNKSEGL